jgi:AcrR family transcriptional regulator
MERAKKDCILSEAAKAFARFGFRKASVDEIAKKAGVAKGTVYLAAESKEDLFYQVMNREVRAWVAECAGAIDHRVSADKLLAELTVVGMEYLESRPLVRELLFGDSRNELPGWAERLDELRSLGRANLVEVLRLGVKQKLFRDDLDVDVVASLLQDLHVSAYLFHQKGTDVRRELGHRAKVGLDLVLRGLIARAPASATASARA